MSALVLGAGATLLVALGWSLEPSLAASTVGVVACALVAAAGQRRLDPRALVCGALAGVALLGPTRDTVAGGALFALALYAPRMLRARDVLGGLALGTMALAGGATIAWLHGEYALAATSHRWAALAVGAFVVGLPALVRIDDPIAHAIRRAARRARGRHRVRLLRGLVLRRRAILPEGPRAVREALHAGWIGLAELAERGDRERIAVRVRALENAHAAADRLENARRSLEAGPDQVREAHDRLAHELAAFEDVASAA